MMNIAHLKTDSPWRAVFPDGCVPIQNILIPQVGVMAGANGEQPQEFYRLDVKKLSPPQREQICELVAKQCGGSRFEVSSAMDRDGFLPLRAIHVTGVSTDMRAFI